MNIHPLLNFLSPNIGRPVESFCIVGSPAEYKTLIV